MAAPVGGPDILFMGFYTALTMAAFEDMGYYKANFSMAEHMEYGHNTGCEFLTDKCMNKGVTKWLNMFCNVPITDGWTTGCTTDRLGLGPCGLADTDSRLLPAHFQYFASKGEGGFKEVLTDYCPVIQQFPSLVCTYSEEQGEVHGSLFGENSMCLEGSELKVKGYPDVPVSAVCAEISCEGGSVKVKYHGDTTGKWYDCPEGQTFTPSSTSDSFVSGTIKCPKYKEVCTVSPDGSSLVPGATHGSMEPSPNASNKSTGNPDGSNSSGKSNDGSSVPFGLIPSVAFLVLSFAAYLIV